MQINAGKTELAKFIFDNFKTEIISVDSAQIYQDMNIGSAKPSSSELNSYPHHLINLIKPTENYSVSQFKKDESDISSKIFKNKNILVKLNQSSLKKTNQKRIIFFLQA